MYDLIIIGSGPGGMAAAAKAAQHKLSVAIIEARAFGGTCLNVGCIPTKTLVHAAAIAAEIRHGSAYGINCPGYTLSIDTLRQKKTAVIDQLRKGAEAGFRKGVDVITGTAQFVSDKEIVVNGETIAFKHAIIATGSEPRNVPSLPFNGTWCLSSDDILALADLPKSCVIVGGGYIGCEWASILAALGCSVDLVEMTDRLIPTASPAMSKRLEMAFTKKGIRVHTQTKIETVSFASGTATLTAGGKSLSADKVLVCIGRQPRGNSCAPEKAGVQCENGWIPVNAFLETNVQHIFAIGDVVRSPQLAHVASYEGEIAVENILNPGSKKVNYDLVPHCIFTDPEIAAVGKIGRADGIVETRLPFGSNGKAVCEDAADGTFILYSEKATGRIVGAEIAGAHATDMISYVTMAVHASLTVKHVSDMIFPHPTFSELFRDAAVRAAGV